MIIIRVWQALGKYSADQHILCRVSVCMSVSTLYIFSVYVLFHTFYIRDVECLSFAIPTLRRSKEYPLSYRDTASSAISIRKCCSFFCVEILSAC